MTTAQLEAIEKHGRNILAIFPNASEKRPIELCKALRRIEGRASKIGLRLCNGPEYPEDELEADHASIRKSLVKLLGESPTMPYVFVNQDPRGYALKIRDQYVRDNNLRIYTDWGGYGILAPEIGKNGF